ncbi:enoyl-CoA hydratase/isomerase family protein [Pseudonocardia sp. GCM10023141]|uniref:enoyl-CoA hydratase/isomerase family protein n=1 Tax=Pseudonocardia sp. GCM10023141 TaxID=3252653 RepID=UPI00361006E1
MDDYSAFPDLLVERAGKNSDVFVVTINKPDRLNAITPQMHTQLGRIWRTLDRDDDCRVIVLTGAGRAFCAGVDFKGEETTAIIETAKPHYRRLRARPGASKILDYILEVEKPIISMINGPAVGLGLILALAADITVASTDAKLGDTHINIGLTPGDGGVLLLPLLVGMNVAKELMMTGDLIDGAEAARIGLVNHAVEPNELKDYTFALADKLASKAPYAIKTTKASINMILRRRALDVMDLSHLYEQLAMRTDDHREGIRSVWEQREPKYTGR